MARIISIACKTMDMDNQLSDATKSRRLSGMALLEKEEKECNRGILTFSQELDKLLGGGIFPGTITEVVGDKGLGKTTFCIQMCLDVQLPNDLDGLDAEAIYIDTEHSLSSIRLKEMADEFVIRCSKLLSCKSLPSGNVLSVEKVMSRIHIVQCCEVDELVRIILSLEKYLVENRRVKLIVIDSIAFPMYTEKESFVTRAKVLYGIGQMLFEIVNKFSLAIVITNNMTTRFGDDGEGSYLIPYLGEAWAHIANQRLVFSWTAGKAARKAELVASNFNPVGSCFYRIVAAGFRD